MYALAYHDYCPRLKLRKAARGAEIVRSRSVGEAIEISCGRGERPRLPALHRHQAAAGPSIALHVRAVATTENRLMSATWC